MPSCGRPPPRIEKASDRRPEVGGTASAGTPLPVTRPDLDAASLHISMHRSELRGSRVSWGRSGWNVDAASAQSRSVDNPTVPAAAFRSLRVEEMALRATLDCVEWFSSFLNDLQLSSCHGAGTEE